MSEPLTTRRIPRPVERSAGLLLPLLLSGTVIASAVAVVQIKHGTRGQTAELERLRLERDGLEIEWAQLELEEAAHSSHARIEAIARAQLKMIEPRETVMAGVKP